MISVSSRRACERLRNVAASRSHMAIESSARRTARRSADGSCFETTCQQQSNSPYSSRKSRTYLLPLVMFGTAGNGRLP